MPVKIHVPRPTRIVPRRKADDVYTYEYTSAGETLKTVGMEDVIHFTEFHPLSDAHGMSGVEAAKPIADIDRSLNLFMSKWFKNAIYPSKIFGSEDAISDEAFERLRADLKRFHAGVDRFHDFILLDRGVKPLDDKSKTPTDSNFVEAKRIVRDETLMALGCYHLVAVMNEASALVIEEAKRLFWEEMIARLKNVASTLNKELLMRNYPGADELEFQFDFRQVPAMRKVLLDESLALFRLASMGIVKINEAREWLGFSGKVPWGEDPPPTIGIARTSNAGLTNEERQVAESQFAHPERYAEMLSQEEIKEILRSFGNGDLSEEDSERLVQALREMQLEL